MSQASREPELRDLYHTSRWMRVRRAYLRLNPRCVADAHEPGCDGMATVVDHVLPRSAGGSTWDRDNWQALSKPCHDSKTRREQGWGGSKRDRPRREPARLVDLSPRPHRTPSRVVVADYSPSDGGA